MNENKQDNLDKFMKNIYVEEDCMVWVHGLVYEEVYDIFRDFKYNPIEDNRFVIFKNRFDQLSDQEKEVIDVVINSFGKYSGKVLETITHGENPWKDARSDCEPLQLSRKVIEKEKIQEYFSWVADHYGIDSAKELDSYIQNHM